MQKKKSENIEVRVSPGEKREFLAACEAAGVSASDYLRKEIDHYIASSFGSVEQHDPPPSPRRHYVSTAIAVVTILFAIGLVLNRLSTPAHKPSAGQTYDVHAPTTMPGVGWEELNLSAYRVIENGRFKLTPDTREAGLAIEFCANGKFQYWSSDPGALFQGNFYDAGGLPGESLMGEWRLLREFDRVALELTSELEQRVTFFVGRVKDDAIDLEGLQLFRTSDSKFCQ